MGRSGNEMTVAECILKVLEEKPHCLTFDELYCKAQPDCDWVSFVEILERLVEQEKVQYILPYGTDIGYYSIEFPQGCTPAG